MEIELTPRMDALEISSFGAKSGRISRGASSSPFLSIAFTLGLLFTSTSELRAREREDLDITLTARRVVRSTNGTEELNDDPVALPGDVISYTAEFRNQSAQALSHLAPTIPVPVGMEYISTTVEGAPMEASLDGQIFESIPVRRPQLLNDGSRVMVEVPASSYRAVRWHAGDLAPGAIFTASARVRVIANVVQR